jgi:hypothetical protein
MIYGVGINDADYAVAPRVGPQTGGARRICPMYTTWQSMLTRCYSDVFQRSRPTYRGCTVDSRWHRFMAFRAWMLTQDWEGKQLDKDIIHFGNKIYSPETCCFVSGAINNLIHPRPGKFLPGVYARGRRFHAYVGCQGVQKHLGTYATQESAHMAYRVAKDEILRSVASEQTDPRIQNGLLNHMSLRPSR